jgi:dTDP-4-amino-4,6-dideoxygalactose transaminase
MQVGISVLENISVPFYRPDIHPQEIEEVVAALRSGWLTSGPRVRRFEEEFARAVGATYAVAVNSCTAALHLAVEALGLTRNQAVLVPTLTFAATAEVVRYQGAIPILVDCDPLTGNLDLQDAAKKLELVRTGGLPSGILADLQVVGIIPVYVGGLMMDMDALQRFACEHNLWIVEDAAHAFPAAWRRNECEPWQWCGQGTSSVSCFSFYANKTITTGEGGMAITEDKALADRMRLMSLHGLSHDAWGRYSGNGSWDYQIVAPGYKYNLTDLAAAIGIHQLTRAEAMRAQRQEIAATYGEALAEVAEIELPFQDKNRFHSWHLFAIKLNLERLGADRNRILQECKEAGVHCSVHWRPLHLHPYYQNSFGWTAEDLPAATRVWERLISLPIFPGMRGEEIDHVMRTIKGVCKRYAR